MRDVRAIEKGTQFDRADDKGSHKGLGKVPGKVSLIPDRKFLVKSVRLAHSLAPDCYPSKLQSLRADCVYPARSSLPLGWCDVRVPIENASTLKGRKLSEAATEGLELD